MQKSLKSAEYARLIATLVAVRKGAGIRQQALAKYEGGERRIDVVEFIAIARALGADPLKLFRDFLSGKQTRTKKATN
jgi:transcriptional regulator with XRE-family HTH domain